MIERVKLVPNSNGLDFDDKKFLAHRDLNFANIFVEDKETLKICAVIDWELSIFGFDKYEFFYGWYFNNEENEAKLRLNFKNKLSEIMPELTSNPSGYALRKYLNSIYVGAYLIVNYVLGSFKRNPIYGKVPKNELVKHSMQAISGHLTNILDKWDIVINKLLPVN